MLPGGQRKRNASVRTFERTSVGEDQFKEHLLKQSSLFRALRFEDSEEWHRADTIAGQMVIFSQGDTGNGYYLISA